MNGCLADVFGRLVVEVDTAGSHPQENVAGSGENGIVDHFGVETVAPEGDRGVDIGRHQVSMVQVDHRIKLFQSSMTCSGLGCRSAGAWL
jgi:hypothetical protein